MRNLLKYVILICLSVVASCSDQNLRYLGYTYTAQIYDPKIDYSYGHKATTEDITPDQVAFGTRPPNFEGTIVFTQGSIAGSTPIISSIRYANTSNTHTHFLLRDYNYAVFCPEGYVSECDIENFKESIREVTGKDIREMMAKMSRKDFVYDVFSKKYLPMVSYAIQDKVMAVKCKNIFIDLAGWQMFKPTDGIDKDLTLYKVEYKGNGWYDIFLPNGHDTVSVKIMYTGKYLNPVIVGVKNRKMNVDIVDTNYKANVGNKMWGFSTNDRDYMFLEYLCPMVYKSASSPKLLSEEDFDILKNKANSLRLSFVQNFYAYLVQSGNDVRKVEKKFRYSLVQHFMGMIEKQKLDGNYDTGMFLPCSYADFTNCDYTITYLGKDWYEVTSSNGDGLNLRLKVVLHGKKLTPAIVGMRNPQKGIDYCPARFE